MTLDEMLDLCNTPCVSAEYQRWHYVPRYIHKELTAALLLLGFRRNGTNILSPEGKYLRGGVHIMRWYVSGKLSPAITKFHVRLYLKGVQHHEVSTNE
jgi:hypothetical protein